MVLMNAIDWKLVLKQLLYDPKNPLLFQSGFFVYFFIVFSILFYINRNKPKTRMAIFSLFSLYFFYKASGWFVILVILAAVVDWLLSNAIYRAGDKGRKKLLLIISIVFNLGILFYFKYTNFFIELVNQWSNSNLQLLNLILPIGISFYTFENLSYTIDVYRGEFKPVKRFQDYLFFLSFFPKLVMGPIVRAADFIPQIYSPYVLNRSQFARGFYLIFTGLFKKVVISDYLQTNYVYRVFEDPDALSRLTGAECLLGVYCYAMVIYCDFSGYSDVAIGIARWFGFDVNLNFLSPYQSKSITEFWRRWHISLSSWLRDYLYIPLGGNRKGKIRTYVNLMITMLLGGFWHGASWNFIIWGGIHGGLLAIERLFGITGTSREKYPLWKKAFWIFITFHLVCFGWVFFKAETLHDASTILNLIATNFHAELIPEMISGYMPVCLMLLFGFILHALPDKTGNLVAARLEKIPAPAYMAIGFAFIWIFIQAKTAEQVLPIYLQF